jgi:hypothetical protein
MGHAMLNNLFKSPAIPAVLSLLLVLTATGCSHYQVSFDLNERDFKPKGKSIAVISGTKETQNVVLANLVGDTLRKKSRYQVLSSAQVSQAIQSYPQNIKGPYKSAYFYIDTDWELGDRKKIADYQRALGVDYLYVIWAPMSVSTNGHPMVRVPAVAQLFEPNAKEVATTSINLLMGDDKTPYFKEGADEVARQLAEETKMALVAKK